MAKLKILKFLFSILLLFFGFSSRAQKSDWQGLNIGVDLSRMILPVIDSTRFGWEFSADYEIIKDMFGIVELGSQFTRYNAANYDYRSDGVYTRIGVDYNFMKHLDAQTTDKILIGMRYGFTTFAHSASNIRVRSDLFSEFNGGSIGTNWLSAQWAEIAFGMKARLFNNFYLGWSARIRIKTWLQNDKVLTPYYIPGYGRASLSNSMGINYTLSYKIPIKKKRISK